ILHYLLLVGLELVAHGFLEADGLGSNHVHQRTTLTTGEYGGVQLLLQLLVGTGEDQTTAGATQGLVGSGGDHVSVGHRVGVDASGDQTGHVGHVDEQVGTDRKSTRLNSSHVKISYAVFCLKKKI